MPIVSIIAGLIAVVAAVVITYYVTVNNLKKDADSKIGNAENKAREIIDKKIHVETSQLLHTDCIYI